MRFFRLSAFLVFVAFLLLPVSGTAKQGDPQFGRSRSGAPPMPGVNDKEHVKARNEMRQKELKNDSEKLLEMATELKQYVDKTNESVLSVEVIRRAEAIEKLAKNVREKMRGN